MKRALLNSSSKAALPPSDTGAAGATPLHVSSVAAGPLWCAEKKGQSGPRAAAPKWNCCSPLRKNRTLPLSKSMTTPMTSPSTYVGICRSFSPKRRTVPGRAVLPPLQTTAFSLRLGSTVGTASGAHTPTKNASSTGCQTRTAKWLTPGGQSAEPTAPPQPVTCAPFVAVSISAENAMPLLDHASQPSNSSTSETAAGAVRLL
mmetsp:Transcript_37681/g.69659  ORF Transcript_37681/g.69659 Transcript_37681/m.69659 type:complete len:203 (+) Transcript_37681:1818-2426(+)